MAKPKYDVIIIGAGPGGLCCNALLSKWGLKTLLVDKNNIPGGKAITIERGGFKYDLEPKLQVPMTGSSLAQIHTELGIESELGAVLCDTVALAYRHKSADKYKTLAVMKPPIIATIAADDCAIVL